MNTQPATCHHKYANHQHGDYAMYALDRCRCESCHTAHTRQRKARERAQLYGTYNRYVPPAAAIAHVKALQVEGMGLRGIAKAAGVSRSSLRLVLAGQRKRITRDTSDRLLAVTIDDAPDGDTINNLGAARRLQALVYNGWSVDRLAEMLDMDRQALDGMLHRTFDKSLAPHVRTVKEAFERLWDKAPSPTSPQVRRGITMAQRRAQEAGWVPALAWDDIDDPNERPNVGTTPRGIDLEEVAWLERQGYPLDVIAGRMGITRNSLDKARERARAKVAS